MIILHNPHGTVTQNDHIVYLKNISWAAQWGLT